MTLLYMTLLEQGLGTRWPPEIPSNHNHSVVLWNNLHTVLAVLYVQVWALHTEMNTFKYHPVSSWQSDTTSFHFYLTEGWKQESNLPNNPTKQNQVIQINQPKSSLALLERIPVCTAALKLRTLNMQLADHLACSIFIFLVSLMFPQWESQPKY